MPSERFSLDDAKCHIPTTFAATASTNNRATSRLFSPRDWRHFVRASVLGETSTFIIFADTRVSNTKRKETIVIPPRDEEDLPVVFEASTSPRRNVGNISRFRRLFAKRLKVRVFFVKLPARRRFRIFAGTRISKLSAREWLNNWVLIILAETRQVILFCNFLSYFFLSYDNWQLDSGFCGNSRLRNEDSQQERLTCSSVSNVQRILNRHCELFHTFLKHYRAFLCSQVPHKSAVQCLRLYYIATYWSFSFRFIAKLLLTLLLITCNLYNSVEILSRSWINCARWIKNQGFIIRASI